MRKDPGYLSRMHMDLLDAHDAPVDPRSVDWSGARTPNFTVRRQSGGWNALGAVKIDLPNPYSVYMHDTNQRNLFNDDYRFDSHGCSRVDNVREPRGMASEGHAAMEPRLDRRGHCHRPAPGYPSAEEISAGLDLSDGMDDEGPDRSVPQ